MTCPIRLLAAIFLWLCSAPAFAEKWALLIGINHYEDANNIASLGAADNDARELKKVLKSQLGFPDANITLLVSDGDTKPTRSNIIEALGNLSQNAVAGDTVFVFYSGHGVELQNKSCLLPYDFRGRNAFTGIETALEVSRFKELLGAIKAKALIMVWDMCRNDPFSKGKSGDSKRNVMKNPKGWGIVAADTRARGNDAPVVANFFACSSGETSFEWTDKNRGYFAYFLEKGIKGEAADAQGNITLGSLARYVRAQVIATTTRNEGAVQSPLPELTGPDAQDFVLATGKAAIKQPTILQPGSETINVTASLDVKANVPGAKVSVNKKPLAGTHFEAELLDEESARFMVVVTAEGYKPSVSRVTLVRGKSLVHPVNLEKLPATVKLEPTPIRPTPEPAPTKGAGRPTTAAALAERVLAAHHWAEFQKLTSIKLSGTARATGSDTEPEDMKAFTITLTPSGDYRMSWLDSAGRNDAGGTALTSWSKENGVLQPEVIGAKSMLFPQGVLGVVAAALQSAPERWSMSSSGRWLELSVADASGSMKVSVDPTTYRVSNVILTIPTTTGVDLRATCTISSYEIKQGIPIPNKIISGILVGKDKMAVLHSYSNIEINVPLKTGFNEAK